VNELSYVGGWVHTGVMGRGSLRIYLGAAPGVGKTYAMLNEGRRRGRGTDVVVGYVETHGRLGTAEQIKDLEVIAPTTPADQDSSCQEMDVDAILARHPQVALIDELAHTNQPGSRNRKRWQDVAELLEAGIDVVSTLNIHHVESVNDVVERITGVAQSETIPDEVVGDAAQVEMVDATPEALRRRMAHGNIYAPDGLDAATTTYFQTGNLAALRELTLRWMADHVDTNEGEHRLGHAGGEGWETRERVVVGISGAPGSERLLRRAARIAQRAHGEFIGVHIQGRASRAAAAEEDLAEHGALLQRLGGRYHETAGADVSAALIAKYTRSSLAG
jgi:two-component system sensor histidine kinase KdpD